MPCRDDGMYSNTGVSERELNNFKANVEREVRKQLEPMLCEAADVLEKHGLLQNMSEEFKTWAAHHEQQEVVRIRQEALAKLTAKEKRALGIK